MPYDLTSFTDARLASLRAELPALVARSMELRATPEMITAQTDLLMSVVLEQRRRERMDAETAQADAEAAARGY